MTRNLKGRLKMNYKAEIHRITDMLAEEELLKILYTVAKTIIRKFPCGTAIPAEENKN